MGPEDFEEEAAPDDDATEAFDSIAEDLKKESQLMLRNPCAVLQDSSMLRSGNAAWLLWRIVDGIAPRAEKS